MPIYLHAYHLLIRKETLDEKYQGGIVQFKKDFEFDQLIYNQEDDLLLAIAYFNPEDCDIEKLIERGLSFDEAKQYSEDFVLTYRYGHLAWKPKWAFVENTIYLCHIDTEPKQVEFAYYFGDTCTADLLPLFGKYSAYPNLVIHKDSLEVLRNEIDNTSTLLMQN